MALNYNDVVAEAQAELDAESHRAAVEAAKVRLRASQGRPWWDRLFPYRIRLEKK